MYDAHQDIPLLQQEDLTMFGRLLLTLCCGNTAVMNSPQKALEIIGRQYSLELRDVALFLITKPGHKVGCSWRLLMSQCVFTRDL
jgi:PAB-dependent poly(A)-specific ribonuclease subunit 3